MKKYQPVFRTILLSALVTCTGIRDAGAAGDIFNLGTIGGAFSQGNAINDAGQVAGDSNTTGDGSSHVFRYSGTPGSGGAIADLGTLGGTNSVGNAINGAGEVAGFSDTTDNTARHVFRYSGTPGSGGAMVDLGTLGGTNSLGFAINDAGEVAGYSNTTGGDAHAFRYSGTPGSGGAMVDLGTLGGTNSLGLGINDAGQVTGDSHTTGNAAVHAFRYTGTPGSGGAMVDLGTLGGTYSAGYSINDAGQVTGYSDTTSGDLHAFRYTGTPGAGGAMVDLGTLGGASSIGFGINDAGFVVGRAARFNSGTVAALWQTDASNTAVDLETWLDATNPTLGAYWLLFEARGINDDGLITGYGNYDDGPGGLSDGPRAYILDASTLVGVPEPSTLALVALGAAALAMRRNRRFTNLLCLCCALSITAAAHAASYTVTDLGTLGGTVSAGGRINDSGQAVGYHSTAGDSANNAFLWTPTNPNGATGAMIGLGTLGGTNSYAGGINDSGRVAGMSHLTGDTEYRAFLWIPTTPNGDSGTLHDLGTLGGTSSYAGDINDSGRVAGSSQTTGDAAFHAFLWTPTTPGGASGTMHDLGTLGGTYCEGLRINDSGQVTGSSNIEGDEFYRAFLWTPSTPNGPSGTMQDLGTLGGSFGEGLGINDSGQVTGSSNIEGDEFYHAFLWTPSTPNGTSGTMQDLGTLGGSYSYAYHVSAGGQVVGYSDIDVELPFYAHAFLHTSGSGMVDLNTLIDPLSGWELSEASDINDAGQITGTGLFNGEQHAYLLTPVPMLDGDYSGNGTVGPEDYSLWKSNFGSTTLLAADGNGDGTVNAADYTVWRNNLGASLPAGGSAEASPSHTAAPEPSACVLAAAGMLGVVVSAPLWMRRRE